MSSISSNVTRAVLLCALTPTSTMVWPFGPSAFQEVVAAKRAQRDDAIKTYVAALQAGDHLTTEEVAIISKSGRSLAQLHTGAYRF